MRSMRPMRPQRAALPGLLVMVLIATGGVFVALAVQALMPDDFLESDPRDGLQAEDIELDPATRLPIIPVFEEAEVITWTGQQPSDVVDGSKTWASQAPNGEFDAETPAVSLMATYPSHEEALAVGQRLAETVGDAAAEAAWLEAAGVEPGDGFEWQGPGRSETPFVQVVDRYLLVDGLEWHELFEGSVDAAPEEGLTFRAPLALALDGSASSVLVESSRSEQAIAFDLVCSGEAEALTTLGQSLADYTAAASAGYALRPPWIDPPLTFEEERARRTLRLVRTLWESSLVQSFVGSEEMARLTTELAGALESGDAFRTRAAADAIEAHLADVVANELPDTGPLADALDPDVLASTMAEYAALLVDASNEVASLTDGDRRARAVPFGASQAATWRDGGAFGQQLVDERRLWFSLASWSGVAQGFEPFVRYLEGNGCDTVRMVHHDFDDVRED